MQTYSRNQNKVDQRIMYSRDFLLDLKLSQLSLHKPKVQLHTPEIVLDKVEMFNIMFNS